MNNMYDDTDKKRNEMGPKSGKSIKRVEAYLQSEQSKTIIKKQVVHIKGMRAQMTWQANNKICQDGGKQV